MSNRDYWRKRQEDLQNALLEPTEDYIKEIKQGYKEAKKELERRISVWYQRFAVNNSMDITTAMRLLNDRELEELNWDLQEYITRAQQGSTWAKELENASARIHINRYEALMLQVQDCIENLYNGREDKLEELVRDIYPESKYRNAYEIYLQTGRETTFDVVDTDKLNRLVSMPWTVDGKNFSERIWEDKETLIRTLDTEFTQAFAVGLNTRDLAAQIAKKMDTDEFNARRLVATETAYFATEGQKDCYTELGVKEYEIVGTLDSTTCKECGKFDGKHFPLSAMAEGATAPPFHCFCRCTTVPYFDDEFTEGEERIARDENGNTYFTTAKTYEEWKVDNVKAAPIKGIREPVDVEFDTSVNGYHTITGGHTVQAGDRNYTVTINKRNTIEWDNLPEATRRSFRLDPQENKPFYLPKGEYEIQRYVEGTSSNAERDEIAKALGGEYIGFNYLRKNGRYFYVDFYQKNNELFCSVGKAELQYTVKEASLEAVAKATPEREEQIIKNIGKKNMENLFTRNGDDWVSAMKEYHRAVQADGKPEILPDEDYNDVSSPTLYRGIAPQSHMRRDITSTLSTKEMADEFFNGDEPFPSRGVYGDGVAYASPAMKKIALNYATNGGTQMHGGVIIEFKLKPDARTILYEEALEIFRKMTGKGGSTLLFNPDQERANNSEVGKAMNALGYDAIIKHNGDDTGEDFYVVLNRAALVTKQNYITEAL